MGFVSIPAAKQSWNQRRLVYGLAVNDADYCIGPKINGRTVACHYYQTWHSMLQRCYDPKYQAKKPTYVGCSVCDEWLIFSTFKAWMEKQDWRGKSLDKDLIDPGNRVYSPDKCMFVSQQMNSLISTRRDGNHGLGVAYDSVRRKYRARVSDGNGRMLWSGRYDTAEEAGAAYAELKRKRILVVASQQSDQRLRSVLLRVAEALPC